MACIPSNMSKLGWDIIVVIGAFIFYCTSIVFTMKCKSAFVWTIHLSMYIFLHNVIFCVNSNHSEVNVIT